MSLPQRAGVLERPLEVLVVDDSAVARQALHSLLVVAGMRVTTAPDPIVALDKLERMRPDVIVLDLVMPRMDGLTFLRRLKTERPVPVVVCSSYADPGSVAAAEALAEGAVAVVARPRFGIRKHLLDSAGTLVEAVRSAAASRPRVVSGLALASRGALPEPRTGSAVADWSRSVVAIGASLGGPEALEQLLSALPASAPAVLVVQHMPRPFTAAFADRLDRCCRIRVKEAANGDSVRCGWALIAPGDHHLVLAWRHGQYVVELVEGPKVSGHRPSVDVLFRSVAEVAGADAVGALLTGMGADGAAGLEAMRRSGAATLAQDEATCVVFGMPRRALEIGATSHMVPLDRMAAMVLAECRRDGARPPGEAEPGAVLRR